MKRLLAKLLPRRFRKGSVEIPVVRLSGTIATGGGLRPSLSLASVAPLLEKAFADKSRAVRRDLGQFARRLAGAVAADLQAHPGFGG